MRYPLCLLAVTSIVTVACFQAQAHTAGAPGCADITAAACVTLAIDAMGGAPEAERHSERALRRRFAHRADGTVVSTSPVYHLLRARQDDD